VLTITPLALTLARLLFLIRLTLILVLLMMVVERLSAFFARLTVGEQ
jgi:hypothetical protein